jgi:hypothetical protein
MRNGKDHDGTDPGALDMGTRGSGKQNWPCSIFTIGSASVSHFATAAEEFCCFVLEGSSPELKEVDGAYRLLLSVPEPTRLWRMHYVSRNHHTDYFGHRPARGL